MLKNMLFWILLQGNLNIPIRQLAQELGLFPELIDNATSWSAKYTKKLDNFGVKLQK